MFEIIGLTIYGFFVGTYGTSIGIGGGPLIVPFLLLCYKIPASDIVATSLCVVFFNVVSGSIAYYKQKRIDIISGTKFGIATIPGALIGTYVPQFFSTYFLSILFGLLILALALYVVFSNNSTTEKTVPAQKKKSDHSKFSIMDPGAFLVKRVIIDDEGNRYVYSFNEKLGMILSAKIGLIATILGIGGGVLHVPMLTKMMNFPVHIAIATAHYKLFICALFGLVSYIHMDYVHFDIAVPMGLGAVLGAVQGARISRGLSQNKILNYLAIVLFIMAFRLLIWPIK